MKLKGKHVRAKLKASLFGQRPRYPPELFPEGKTCRKQFSLLEQNLDLKLYS